MSVLWCLCIFHIFCNEIHPAIALKIIFIIAANLDKKYNNEIDNVINNTLKNIDQKNLKVGSLWTEFNVRKNKNNFELIENNNLKMFQSRIHERLKALKQISQNARLAGSLDYLAKTKGKSSVQAAIALVHEDIKYSQILSFLQDTCIHILSYVIVFPRKTHVCSSKYSRRVRILFKRNLALKEALTHGRVVCSKDEAGIDNIGYNLKSNLELYKRALNLACNATAKPFSNGNYLISTTSSLKYGLSPYTTKKEWVQKPLPSQKSFEKSKWPVYFVYILSAATAGGIILKLGQVMKGNVRPLWKAVSDQSRTNQQTRDSI